MTTLVPCSNCDRHVARDGAACPFCGASAQGSPTGPVLGRRQLTRAAVFFGAAVLTGCGGSAAGRDETTGDGTTRGGGTTGGDATDGGGDDGFAHASDDGPSGSGGDGADTTDGGAGDDDAGGSGDPDDPQLVLDPIEEHPGGGPCTPDGQCPPYGAPPLLDDELV
ncbi:MAG TPA: hypothetical protein RMH99_22180 [Sandaracinaceae bacterium LLY-WYZ-13_1]|nr:hypothetical protein [Sandaracinaceae bacterium LLY-WYZ-13_1]